MKVTLIVSDRSVTPEITTTPDGVQVRIGMHDDYDSIFRLCRDQLSEDELVLLYRLWGDDYFPRNFLTVGGDIYITARD